MKPELFVEMDLPNDEEIERLTRYVGGYMSAEEVELFDRQLEQDREFFYRMAPMLDAWHADPLPIELEVLAELDAREHQKAITQQPAPLARRVPRTRWRPLVGIGGLAIAAEVLLTFVQVGTQAAPDAARMVAQAPKPDSIHATHAPPATVVVQPRAPRPAKAPVPVPVVIATIDADRLFRALQGDSATNHVVAAMDSVAVASAFVPSARVADTGEVAGVQTYPMWRRSAVADSTLTVSGFPQPAGSSSTPKSQSGGLLGILKRLFGGDKK